VVQESEARRQRRYGEISKTNAKRSPRQVRWLRSTLEKEDEEREKREFDLLLFWDMFPITQYQKLSKRGNCTQPRIIFKITATL